MANHILVLGGIRSGKSQLAESLISQCAGPVCYLATATAGDGEMHQRIQQHQARRPPQWGLREEPLRLAETLNSLASGEAPAVLVDCMSLWLSNLLHAGEAVFQQERSAFLTALADYPAEVVVVSNEVGLGTIGMDPLTRRFCDELGWLNQDLARQCHQVHLSIAGLPQRLK